METALKNELINKILSLSPIDRVEIVDKVLDEFNKGFEYDFQADWAEESERRIDAVFEGNIELIPAKEVFNKINE
jgi:putative addiction module component (TIGR02574 family)